MYLNLPGSSLDPRSIERFLNRDPLSQHVHPGDLQKPLSADRSSLLTTEFFQMPSIFLGLTVTQQRDAGCSFSAPPRPFSGNTLPVSVVSTISAGNFMPRLLSNQTHFSRSDSVCQVPEPGTLPCNPRLEFSDPMVLIMTFCLRAVSQLQRLPVATRSPEPIINEQVTSGCTNHHFHNHGTERSLPVTGRRSA